MGTAYKKRLKYTTVTIANGATTSDAAELDGDLVGVITDSGYDSGTITFSASTTLAGTYSTVYDASNTAVSIDSAAASRWYALSPGGISSVAFVKLISATSQTGATTLTLITQDKEE